MGKLDKLKTKLTLTQITTSLTALKSIKKAQFFDDKFYQQFEGQYFNGVPIYHYLEKMSMGKCYDTSAILALALGDGANVCRGELGKLSELSGDTFGHGWVEMDGMVYDTTWKVICDESAYRKIFGVKDDNKMSGKDFFKNVEKISDWNIRTKEYYENNYVPFVKPFVYGLYEKESMRLQRSIRDNEKKYISKLLSDLPDVSKMPEPDINIFESTDLGAEMDSE